MKLETFIAKRYLLSRHKINFITIISFISITGITLGVAALIVILSVFNGFGSLVTKYLMNFEPHVRVQIISEKGEKNYKEAYQVVNNVNRILDYTPFVSGKVMALNNGLTEVVNLKGIDKEVAESVYNFSSAIIYGDDKIASSKPFPKVILGIQLAVRLSLTTGDTLTLISPSGIEKSITQLSMPLSKKVIITGIYSSNNNDYDEKYIITDIEFCKFLLGYKNNIGGYEIRLEDSEYAFDVQKQLKEKLSASDFTVSTWFDFHKELFSVMEVERWTAYIILSLIIAVATFNILGSLSMSVIEKRRDIGILNAMGINQNSVIRIFMFEGILIGIIGTLLGAVLGYFICYLQLKYNIYPLDPAQFKINALPIEIRISDFFYISGGSLMLAFFAALYPARKASKVNPLEAIKWE
jgi:lipoprotein-releasing system permease protein